MNKFYKAIIFIGLILLITHIELSIFEDYNWDSYKEVWREDGRIFKPGFQKPFPWDLDTFITHIDTFYFGGYTPEYKRFLTKIFWLLIFVNSIFTLSITVFTLVTNNAKLSRS